MTPTFSIIIPTIGRSTLLNVLRDVIAVLGPNDEALIVSDGPSASARGLVAAIFDTRCRYVETLPTNHWGAEQFDLGMSMATKDLLWLASDDDHIPLSAGEVVRTGATDLSRVHVFSMMYLGRVMGGSTRCGSVSGQQIVLPANLPRAAYAARHDAINDWAFLDATLALQSTPEPIFHTGIISHLQKNNRGRML